MPLTRGHINLNGELSATYDYILRRIEDLPTDDAQPSYRLANKSLVNICFSNPGLRGRGGKKGVIT